jgi:hypothetical protein
VGRGVDCQAMERWRKVAVVLTVLAMLIWTVLIFFLLGSLAAPAIEGAAEIAERTRLVILGCWLLGLAVGGGTLVGLWRRTFDGTPRNVRLLLTATAYVAATVIVVTVYWIEIAGVLLFLAPPLAAALLLLTAWAASPLMRRHLGMALLAWLIGVTIVGAVWWVAPRTVGVHLWAAWGLVTLAPAIWWILPLARPPRRTPLN